MWDVDEPRRDELRASAPEAAPHRSRKNTRRWCRGKVGVEHVTEIRETRYGWRRVDDGPLCYRPEWWTEHWVCRHQEVCTSCGKILQHTLAEACPDLTSEITRFRATR